MYIEIQFYLKLKSYIDGIREHITKMFSYWKKFLEGVTKAKNVASDLSFQGYDVEHPVGYSFHVNICEKWGLSFSVMNDYNALESTLTYDSELVYISEWNYRNIIVHEDKNFIRASVSEICRLKKILEEFPGGIPSLNQVYYFKN